MSDDEQPEPDDDAGEAETDEVVDPADAGGQVIDDPTPNSYVVGVTIVEEAPVIPEGDG